MDQLMTKMYKLWSTLAVFEDKISSWQERLQHWLELFVLPYRWYRTHDITIWLLSLVSKFLEFGSHAIFF